MSGFLINRLLPHAGNRYVRHLLRLFEKRVFQEAHTWPACSFPWTKKQVAFCLSFDCDTSEDVRAIPNLLVLLDRYNIKASFALIGTLVEESPGPYRQVVAAGHEIINHGYSKHMEKDEKGEYYSSLFYHQLSQKRIEEEIVWGHECLQKTLGVKPIGFRTPHFGTFQEPNQINILYNLLQKHGYRYSSSVLMLYAKQRGYLRPNRVIQEFPLAARIGAPLSVFDSWGFCRAPGRRLSELDFFPQFKKMMDVAFASKKPMFINIYCDPSHVVNFAGFQQCLIFLNQVKSQIWIGLYNQIVYLCDLKRG